MYVEVLCILNELRFFWKYLLFLMVYQYRGMIKNKLVKLIFNSVEVGFEKFCWIIVIFDIYLFVVVFNFVEIVLILVFI